MNYTTSTVDGENDTYEGIKTYSLWSEKKINDIDMPIRDN